MNIFSKKVTVHPYEVCDEAFVQTTESELDMQTPVAWGEQTEYKAFGISVLKLIEIYGIA